VWIELLNPHNHFTHPAIAECRSRLMTTLNWIIVSGLLMSSIALVGSFTLLLKPLILEKLLLLLVVFAAGTLFSVAFFHMIPASLKANLSIVIIIVWIVCGFTTCLVIERFLYWHHSHQSLIKRKELLTYMILIGDGFHNFLGGMVIAGTFIIDTRLGIFCWLAVAVHEVPKELKDFSVLVHGGWSKGLALFFNFLSGLTFLIGGLITYILSFKFDVSWVVPFAVGNFIYIGMSGLVTKINKNAGANLKNIMLTASVFILGVYLFALAIPYS
jgi:zinc and cadmium transporter